MEGRKGRTLGAMNSGVPRREPPHRVIECTAEFGRVRAICRSSLEQEETSGSGEEVERRFVVHREEVCTGPDCVEKRQRALHGLVRGGGAFKDEDKAKGGKEEWKRGVL
jgi:hypothetical protein